MLSLARINKSYKIGQHKLHVLRDVELEVADGEFASIMGASGSGKSTLLNVIGILDSYDSASTAWTARSSRTCPRRAPRSTATASSASCSRASTCCRSRPRSRTSRCHCTTRAWPGAGATPSPWSTSSVGLRDWAEHRPARCRVDRSSASPSRARSSPSRGSSSPTNRPARSTARPAEQIMELLKDIHATGITMMVVTHDADVAARPSASSGSRTVGWSPTCSTGRAARPRAPPAPASEPRPSRPARPGGAGRLAMFSPRPLARDLRHAVAQQAALDADRVRDGVGHLHAGVAARPRQRHGARRPQRLRRRRDQQHLALHGLDLGATRGHADRPPGRAAQRRRRPGQGDAGCRAHHRPLLRRRQPVQLVDAAVGRHQGRRLRRAFGAPRSPLPRAHHHGRRPLHQRP
jgi:putative ABC transport system ATP-binding protein